MQYQANENKNSVPKTTMQVDESMLQTMNVRGIGPVKTLIDSGYGGCAISLDLLTDSLISQIDPESKNCQETDPIWHENNRRTSFLISK